MFFKVKIMKKVKIQTLTPKQIKHLKERGNREDILTIEMMKRYKN